MRRSSHASPISRLAALRLERGAQGGKHGLMAARRLDAAGLVVVLLGGAEAGMAQYQMGVADMCRVVEGDRRGGGVAEPMRRHTFAESGPGLPLDDEEASG